MSFPTALFIAASCHAAERCFDRPNRRPGIGGFEVRNALMADVADETSAVSSADEHPVDDLRAASPANRGRIALV